MTACSRRGQATVEFALVSMVAIVLVLAIMDFGVLFISRIAATQSTRAAARFGATNPTAWTTAGNPPAGTIEGAAFVRVLPITLANDDAHITISYLVPGAGSATLCGSWSAATGQFLAQPGYTQATCVTPGSLVQVQAVYRYNFVTPILGRTFGGVNISTRAAAYEEI